MQPHKEILIQNLVEKSDEALADAKLAIENNRLSNAQNRIYYSIFYIVSALAYINDFTTSKHGQLLGWFNKSFIKQGIFDKELSVTYKEAFETRQKSDYEFTYKPTEVKVKTLYGEAEIFVKIINNFINNQNIA